MTASLPGTAVSPAAVNRLTRLWVRRSRNRVIQVDVIVRGEVRIERDPEQAAFTGGLDREAHEWCAEQRVSFDHAQLPALLADKKPSIRRKSHRCG